MIQPSDVVEPEPASWEELARVHTAEYLAKMRDGTLSPEDLAQLELPWSVEMVDGFRTMVGGTVQAARMACGLQSDINRRARREIDFCELGGSAFVVAISAAGSTTRSRTMAKDSVRSTMSPWRFAISRRAVSNASPSSISTCITETALRSSSSESATRPIFTFSMHQQHNYPMWKPAGTLDIGLPDGTGDTRYLRELEQALPSVLASRPECVFYLAGADPYEDDQLGGLRLTREGLRRRDRMVIERVAEAGLPLVITLAGGYARHVEDTVAIHAATIEEAANAV